MVKVERKQKLMWKLNPTVFQVINQEVLYSAMRPLGTSVAAVSAMTSSSEEMKAYLPELVGASPDNTAVDWQARVEKWWNDFHLDVPMDGYEMDTSVEVEYFGRYKTNIDKFLKDRAIKVNSDEEAEKIMAEKITELTVNNVRVVPENEVYRYAHPTNMEQYLHWRYCLVSPQVANRPEDVNKSANIRFYIHDEEAAIKRKQETANLFKQSLTAYNQLISSNADKSAYGNILLVYNNVKLEDIAKMTLEDCQMAVGRMPYEKPKVLLQAIADTNIADKAKVLRYIQAGLLRKVDNSDSIIDATTLNPIGANLEDAVVYIRDEANKTYAAELKAKYAALKK